MWLFFAPRIRKCITNLKDSKLNLHLIELDFLRTIHKFLARFLTFLMTFHSFEIYEFGIDLSLNIKHVGR